jgi:microcystin-dependent protein
VDGTEGEALDPVLVNRCFSPRTSRHICPDRGWSYIGGLDIGISRNASAFAVVAVRRGFDGHGEFQLADLDVWTPLLGERVNLSQVEAAIARAHERYHLADCRFDPFQAAHLASRLASGQVAVPSKQLGRLAAPGSRIRMTEVSFTTANLSKMASVLVQAITDGRFSSYCDHVTEQLRRDLLAVRLIERPYGSRLEFPTQADRSHGDAGTATVLAMLGASELAAKRVVTAGAGGFGVGHSSLADMNEEVWRREQERIATVQSELEQRMREIRDFPKHQDHPLWRALYRAGSPRVC